MTDPDVAREESIARDYLTRILRPRLVAGVDADALADHYVAWLRVERDWRPGLPAKPWHAAVSGQPAEPNDDWKAARAALETMHVEENS